MLCIVPATVVAQPVAAPTPQTAATTTRLGTIIVTASPLAVPRGGVSARKVPGNVQSASAHSLQASQTFALSRYLNRYMGSVFINAAQDNHLQPNIAYRGYMVSPLLGLPQGLAVYQDGVRINEPFGASVNFSLIPQSAIARIQLIPGANPVFGRNALGGALSVQTKSGFSDPGFAGEARYGSFERRYLQAQVGGHGKRFGYFFTGEYFTANGWRDYSPSMDKRAFGKLSWRNSATRVDFGVTAANTDLIGNGSTPVQLLATDHEAIFTRPDQTQSRLRMFEVTARHEFGQDTIASGDVYFRRNDIATLNGDDSDYAPCEASGHAGLLCSGVEEGHEEVVYNTHGKAIEATPAVLGGTKNTSATDQDGYGGRLQFTLLQNLFGRDNHLTLGVAVNGADIDFQSQTELARLDATRLAVGSGVYDRASQVAATIHNLGYGVYFTDTWSATKSLALTLAGRYNRTRLAIDDQRGQALDGDHGYAHFNPALGATYWFTSALGAYARYSVSNRTPAAVELTCADPKAPCRLPNDFVSDPDLQQVIARSQELGMRGRWDHLNATLAVFRSVNHHDIQFISAGKLQNTGYFKNIGKTLRQGVELTLNGWAGRFQWFLDYTWLDAEYRVAYTARSPNHPYADAQGDIFVQPGDHIPGVPSNLFKAGLEFDLTSAFRLGATLQGYSGRFLRGDESNQLEPIGGYMLMNVHARYSFSRHLSLFVQVTNLFNRNYASFGVLGDASDVLGDEYNSPRFVSPGAPRALQVGLRASF